MQNRFLIFLYTALLSLFLVQAQAAPEVLMTFGTDEDNQRGRLNAFEMSSDSVYNANVNYSIYIGNNQAITGIGYLNDGLTFKQICAERGYRCKDFIRDYATAKTLQFSVYNNTSQVCNNLKLVYHRHGQELNRVTITPHDSRPAFSVSVGPGQEARHSEHTIDVVDYIIPQGEVDIVINYDGGASGNGHFIDYIALIGECF